MHHPELILTLTAGMAAALVLGFITHWLHLSPIVGYLLGGLVVGPYTPGFVANQHLADQLAEIGVILLMFGVGLQFHLRELLAVRRVAMPGAIGQSLFATLLGAWVAIHFGWSVTAGVVFGLAIAVASTVVLTRVLADNHQLHTLTGHIAVGWLVVEDLFTVLVLVLLPVLFGGGPVGPWQILLAVVVALVKLAALAGFALIVGDRVIPWVLTRAARTRSRELFTLTVLVVALGIAVGSSVVFGASMALGAFLAGLVVGRSEFSLRAAVDALPLRDAFAVLFFVSVGMLFDPVHLLREPWLVLATLAVILIGKPLAALLIVLVMGYPFRVALAVAISLAQIGEFSFILAAQGKQLGVLPASAMNTLVACAIVSITLNPLLFRLVGPLDDLRRRLSRRGAPAPAPAPETAGEASPRHRAILVGHGPVGRTLARLLEENGIEPTIIEMNLETVRGLHASGRSAVYGDASHPEILRGVDIGKASSLILGSSETQHSAEIIRQARELNPNIRVLARAGYLGEVGNLLRAGANHVFASEGEIALAMTEQLLRDLGASPERIDRERQRIREELFGPAPPSGPASRP